MLKFHPVEVLAPEQKGLWTHQPGAARGAQPGADESSTALNIIEILEWREPEDLRLKEQPLKSEKSILKPTVLPKWTFHRLKTTHLGFYF